MNWANKLRTLSGPDSRILREGIGIVAKSSTARTKKHPLALPEQPFDSQLLRASRLFSRSRRLYLASGGKFCCTVVSSARTLSSAILLEQEIEYTPVERELIWSAELGDKRLLQTRPLCTSLFHEQNHRLLWRLVPAPSRVREEVSRYLNFLEALVVATDMALGDELGHRISRFFYLAGLTYDPGTDIRSELSSHKDSRRVYRNYLQACLYATYMKLQFFEEADIHRAVHHLFPGNRKLTERAIRRALRLDQQFVQITNPVWQKKHLNTVIRKLGRSGPRALRLPDDPLQNHVQYLWAERWFDQIGI